MVCVDEHPNRTIVEIEVLVLIGMIFLFTLLICGSFRHKSNNQLLQLLLYMAYITSYPLVSYTIGMMQSAGTSSSLFPIWAVFLFVLLGSTDTISAYNLEEIENWKTVHLQLVVQTLFIVYLLSTSGLPKSTSIIIYILFWLVFMRAVQRAIAFRYTGISLSLQKHTKIIADYMKIEHSYTTDDQVNPSLMKGYHYVVTGEEELEPSAFITQEATVWNNNKIITVENIWSCPGRFLSSEGELSGKLKDVCLSFALFKMIKRRFSGYPFAESHQPKTRQFVFDGLLGDGHERAFRVVEVELGFLYDYFYTKYPVIYLTETFTLILSLLILLAMFILILRLSMVPTQYKKGYKNTHLIVTVLFVVLISVCELAQMMIYLSSDWAKVSLLTRYVAKPSWQRNRWIHKVVECLCKLRCGTRNWKNTLGQYSLLQNFIYTPKCSAILYCISFGVIDKKLKGKKEMPSVQVPIIAKEAIIKALLLSNGELNNGISSLQRNNFLIPDISWACALQSNTETILVWHLATELCIMRTAQNRVATNYQQEQRDNDRKVATCLSRYCAYLVVFVPELLLDNVYDSTLVFSNAVTETKGLYKQMVGTNMHDQLIQDGNKESLVYKGGCLARELLEYTSDDEAQLWKVLAEYWAEMILYLAPSDNAKGHLKNLANGGEFLTQLWALLSHAGILQRPPSENTP